MPGVLSVTWNDPAPATSGVSGGSTAAASELVNCTVPVYPVAVLLNWSSAVTVAVNGVPAVTGLGAATTNRLATSDTTVVVVVPVIDGVVLSVTVTDCVPAVRRTRSNVPRPLASVTTSGRVLPASVAWASVDVIVAVPPNVIESLPNASCAFTV